MSKNKYTKNLRDTKKGISSEKKSLQLKNEIIKKI